MTAPAITARAVSTSFGTTRVLHDVDLHVPSGANLALIGPSAAGKTVLLKCLLGLQRLDGGEVELGDVRIDRHGFPGRAYDARMARTGVLFQQNALFDSKTNWENVAFRLSSGDRAEARRQAVELIESVGLGADVADQMPADLSGGMQKRVGLARALIGAPDLLILDNPTAGLDPVLSAGIEQLIAGEVAERDVTVLTVTATVEGLLDRFTHVAVMDRGRIHWSGSCDEARTSDNPYLVQMLSGSRDGPIRMAVEA